MKKNLYFLGIGGIGMSALVRYFNSIEKNISGYDRTETELTKELSKLNIKINYDDSIDNILEDFLDIENTLIVYTPAIPKDNKQLLYFKNNGFEMKKRAEVLGIITKNTFNLAVAGTHGKTTTSSILSHIFYEIKKTGTGIIGGILEGYNSNYLEGDSKTTIVEADEFDKSFLHLTPNIACITSTDADHLDIYSNYNHLKDTFIEFANKLENKENLIVNKNINLDIKGVKTYSINDDTTDFYSNNIRFERGKYIFDFNTKDKKIENIELTLIGNHNVENTTVAIAMAYLYGLDLEDIKKAISTFKGIKRRCSIKINNDNLVYIDDYAHHPTEIKSILDAVKNSFKNKKLTVIFQPHLFSRTKDFMNDFAEELSKCDEIILLDIYPAREKPIEGITSKILLNKITNSNKILLNKSELIPYLKNSNLETLVTIGAGDIGMMVEDIKDNLL